MLFYYWLWWWFSIVHPFIYFQHSRLYSVWWWCIHWECFLAYPLCSRPWRDQDQLSWTEVIPQHETPVTICMANTIDAVHSRCLFRVLFDSGSNVCMIKKSALLQNLILKESSALQDVKTLANRLMAHQVVTLQDIHLPEFDKNCQISQQKA